MNYPGIVSYAGMTIGHHGGFAGGAIARAPASQTARIIPLQPETRRQIEHFVQPDRRDAGGIDAPLSVLDVPGPRPRFAPHNGTVLAFLTQHIAQEVVPEMAGPQHHASAAEAYIGARDFNAAMLPQGAGFDIRI